MGSPTSASRFDVYKRLLLNEKHWGRTIGVISCKMLREEHNRDKFNQVVKLLASQDFCRVVESNEWYLAFTGGTYRSLHPEALRGFEDIEAEDRLFCLAPSALGVIQIINLVVYGYLRAVLFFNDMEDYYADSPQNLCLRRICNHCNVPVFEDFNSIEYVVKKWAKMKPEELEKEGKERDDQPDKFPWEEILDYYCAHKNRIEEEIKTDQEKPISELADEGQTDHVLLKVDLAPENRFSQRESETLAVIAHNQMKMRMLNFCLGHMNEILSYRRVLTTGTTGARLKDQYKAALKVLGTEDEGAQNERREAWGWQPGESVKDFLDRKIQPFRSGPEGGDIQISSKVIEGTCHRVLFFQDPQTAHPHQFDIRLMEKVAQDQDTAALFATSVETAAVIV